MAEQRDEWLRRGMGCRAEERVTKKKDGLLRRGMDG